MAHPTHNGLVVVDKPMGWTSHDVVGRLRRIYGQRRVGHAGTLDPDATGVLLVGLGFMTRFLRFLQDTTKEYRAEVVFGIATTTLDAAGDVVEQHPMVLTREQVEAMTARFVGEIEQVPPMVSAIQVGGRRLHDLAREGIEVERAPRRVRIDRIEVEDFESGEYPRATVSVTCGSGTYIRSLAADLGTALGGRAHVAALRRVRVGPFGLAAAHTLESIEADPASVVLSPADALAGLERLTVGGDDVLAVRRGRSLAPVLADAAGCGDAPFAVLDDGGALLAVYQRRGASLRPVVVYPAELHAGSEPHDVEE